MQRQDFLFRLAFCLSISFLQLSILLTSPERLSASTLVHRSMKDLVARAAVITVADVEGVESFRQPGGVIFTHITFRLIESLVGANENPTLEVYLPGGDDGEERHEIPGVPVFREGDRVVLLIKSAEEGAGITPFVGAQQGVFRVDPERSTVYTYQGNGVLGVDSQGELRLTKTEIFPGLATHPSSQSDVEIVTISEAADGGSGVSDTEGALSTNPLSTTDETSSSDKTITLEQFREVVSALAVSSATAASHSKTVDTSSIPQFGSGVGSAAPEPPANKVTGDDSK